MSGTQWIINVHEFSFLLSVHSGMIREADTPGSNTVRVYLGSNMFFSIMIFSLLGDEE